MTHGVHFLPQVDQIIVIEDGRISEVCSTLHYLSRLPAKSYVEKKSDSTVAKKKKNRWRLLFSRFRSNVLNELARKCVLFRPRNSTVKLSISIFFFFIDFSKGSSWKNRISLYLAHRYMFNAYTNEFVYGFCLHQKDLNDRKILFCFSKNN